jgi:hypothetical protein
MRRLPRSWPACGKLRLWRGGQRDTSRVEVGQAPPRRHSVYTAVARRRSRLHQWGDNFVGLEGGRASGLRGASRRGRAPVRSITVGLGPGTSAPHLGSKIPQPSNARRGTPGGDAADSGCCRHGFSASRDARSHIEVALLSPIHAWCWPKRPSTISAILCLRCSTRHANGFPVTRCRLDLAGEANACFCFSPSPRRC